MIRASATYYAILICLIIGGLCSSIILISGLNHDFIQKEKFKNEVYLELENGIQWSLSKLSILERKNNEFEVLDTKLNLSSYPWGLLDVVVSEKQFQEKRYQRIALVGQIKTDTNMAIYLVNKNSGLSVAGKTKIKGDAFLPKKGVERAHITGHFFEGSQLIHGRQLKSTKSLPEFSLEFKEKLNDFDQRAEQQILLSKLSREESNFNSFGEATIEIVIEQSNIDDYQIAGNYILKSEDSISISSSSKLNGVLVIARIVRIEEGFNGNLQIMAKERIHIEKNAQLKYPSFLILKEKLSKDEKHFIRLEENSIVAGGILALSDKPDYRNPVEVILKKNSKLVGDIVSTGSTEILGSVYGSIYTDHFSLNTGASEYTNHLMDASIDVDQCPENFMGLICFENTHSKKQIISWLK